MTFNPKTFALVAALAGSALAAPAFAADASRFTLGVTAGSLGVGPEVTYDITSKLAVRGNATFLTINHDFSTGSLHYAGEADLASGGVALDYKPFGGGFFLSAGVRYDGNRVKATASPMGAVTLNGVSYTPAQIGVLSAKADFRAAAPTVSLGYRFYPTRHVVFGLEGGAMFMGAAKISTPTYTGTGISPADLEAERAQLQSQVDKYQTYPVLQATLAYRF
jgi:hypothetical protein